MLVLSRHRDESIIIGDDVVIAIVDIRLHKVRLGITAPLEISVHRREVYEAIQSENALPAASPTPSTSTRALTADLRGILADPHVILSDRQARVIAAAAEVVDRRGHSGLRSA